jgi:hypothetical protein
MADAASGWHPAKSNFKSAAMSNQTFGHDPLVARCSSTDLLCSALLRLDAAAVERQTAEARKMLAFILAMGEAGRCCVCSDRGMLMASMCW